MVRTFISLFAVFLIAGCSLAPSELNPSDQFSVLKGFPGNTYSRDDAKTIETYCVVRSEDGGECWQLVVRRFFVEFTIPDKPVDRIVLTFDPVGGKNHLLLSALDKQPSKASYNAEWSDLFNMAGDQTAYYGAITNESDQIELNQTAVDDFNAAVAAGQGWFAIGFRHSDDLKSFEQKTNLVDVQIKLFFR